MELFVCRAVCRQSKHSEHNVRGQRSEEEPIKPQSLVSCCRNMKSLGVLTVLGLVLVYSQVQGLPTQQETKGCSKVLRPEELHKVSGSWILVFVTYDQVKSEMRQISLMGWSQVEVKVQPDNRTLCIQEDNMLFGKCGSLTYNLTLSESGTGVQQMHMHNTVMTIDGRMVAIDERATLYILNFSQNTFNLLYKSKNSDEEMLLTYKRDGLHEEDLQKELVEHRAKAECLGLSGETFKDWLYDSRCDGICNKRQTLGPGQLHQVTGDWVLVVMTYDNVTSHKWSMPRLTSTLLKIQVQTDNQTVTVQENSMVGGWCVSYPYNVTVTQSGTGVQQLHVRKTEMFIDGELVRINEEASLQLLPFSPNTMKLIYKGSYDQGRMLAIYRRRGHHEEDLDSDLVEHRVKAHCVGLSGETVGEWKYDGKSDFCYRSSAPATVQS